MALFGEENKKKNSVTVKTKAKKTKVKPQKGSSQKLFKTRSRFSSEGVEAVVEVKTVGDIPPVIEARKQIGAEDLNGAAQTLFKAAVDDYARSFGAKTAREGGNRNFFISELKDFKIQVPEMGLVDNHTIIEALSKLDPEGENMTNRVNTLKKLTSFYLNYYEKARFHNDYQFDGDELVSKFSEIYSYMDIMRLYFSRNMEV